MFAQVAGTYEEKTEEATQQISEIEPRKNLYSNGNYTYNDYGGSTYRWSIGHRSESIVQKNIPIEPGTTYKLSYDMAGDESYMYLLTHSEEATTAVHNTLFREDSKVRQLRSSTGEMTEDGHVTYLITAGENEHYVSLTSGNISPSDEDYGPFEIQFDNITLMKTTE